MKQEEIPTVYGKVRKGQSIFRCEFCKVNHYHGWNKAEEGTHRVSHCTNPNSPFKHTGYYLKKSS